MLKALGPDGAAVFAPDVERVMLDNPELQLKLAACVWRGLSELRSLDC